MTEQPSTLGLHLMDCISSHNFPTSETRRRKAKVEWTRCCSWTWWSTAIWTGQSIELRSNRRPKHIWLFFWVHQANETACLRVVDDMFTRHKSKANYFLHKIDGITHKQLVNMAPWMTSSSGRTLKARRHIPTTWNVSKMKTIPNSCHVKLLMLLKNQSLSDLIKVPHSGTANAKTTAHFQAMTCSVGISAESSLSGTDNRNKTLDVN